MDKLEELKHLITVKYGKFLLMLTKGYPMVINQTLLEAIKAVDDVSCYEFTSTKKDIIINYHLMKLKKDGK